MKQLVFSRYWICAGFLLFFNSLVWAQGPGTITTFAGTGQGGFSGDGGPATLAKLGRPAAVFGDLAGNTYIADAHNHRIRKVDASGIITTVAGNGTAGYSGDGGLATQASLNLPYGISVDNLGNIYIADQLNHRIRKVDTSGIITTVAGNGTAGYSGDGGPATAAGLNQPWDVYVDGSGEVYVADRLNHRIRKVDTSGIITTVAGNGTAGYSGDGVAATAASLKSPLGLLVDAQGILFIADDNNQRIRKVDLSGIITTVAGNDSRGYSGDGMLSTETSLNSPHDVYVDQVGNIFIADTDNDRIRKVASIIIAVPDTVAGYATQIEIPVRISNNYSDDVVSAELSISYRRGLLTPTGVSTLGTLAAGWSIETNVVPGMGDTDTLKIAMATDQDALSEEGMLARIDFEVADIRHPASSLLTLTHVLLNDGTPGNVATDGSVTLVGVDGTITSLPSEIIPRWSVGVSVYDVDEDWDVGTRDAFAVGVANGGQTETLMVIETGNSTGIYSGVIGTAFSLSFTSDDGIVQAQASDQIVFSYADSLDSNGDTQVQTDATDVLGGTDGAMRTTVVSQPGDTVRVRVSDADLSDAVAVDVTNPRTGETESIVLSQFTAGESYFYGRFFTDSQAGVVGDSTLEVAKGDVLGIAYADTLTANGGTATVSDDDEVVDPFGDAHANGSVQAFDAAQVLIHRLSTYSGGVGTLSGLDSLSANVDQGAPFGIIDGYDASLVLRKVVGLVDRFEVQAPDAANHPQPETTARPKKIPEERELTLRVGEGYVSVWADERSGIVSGEMTLEGRAGQAVLSEELSGFLSASRVVEDGVRIVFAGAGGVDGPGELLRVYGVEPESARLTRVRLNGGRLGVRTREGTGVVRSRRFALLGNAPNPFNPETSIGFELGEEGWVELTVYDVLGQRIRRLVAESLRAGVYRMVWDGRDVGGGAVSSGVYFYRLQAGQRFTEMRRMMLLK